MVGQSLVDPMMMATGAMMEWVCVTIGGPSQEAPHPNSLTVIYKPDARALGGFLTGIGYR